MPATLAAPLAEIRVNGVKIGYMKTVRVSESYRHAVVKGIGRLNGVEAVATDFNGSLTCAFYTIDLKKSGVPGAIQRVAPDVQSMIDGVLLNDKGVDVVLFRKVATSFDPATGLPTVGYEEFATIKGCFLEEDDFDLSEGQISGKNQRFVYLNPITLPA